MNKKVLISLIVFVLAASVIAGVLVWGKQSGEENLSRVNRGNFEINEKNLFLDSNEKGDIIKNLKDDSDGESKRGSGVTTGRIIQNEGRFGDRLSDDYADLVRYNDEIPWYNIPEMGIKFKVSENIKDDLGYIVEYSGDSVVKVFFYQKSITDFLGEDVCYDDESIKERCSEGIVSYIKLRKGVDERTICKNIVGYVDNGIVCFLGPQSSILSKDQRERYNEIFGGYLGSRLYISVFQELE